MIEDYCECDGVIVVPAGARLAGDMQDADPSGYVRIEFDSLIMPEGSAVPIQAVATNWKCVLKGKVEGKNTGKTCWSGRGSARLWPCWSDAAI